MDGARFELGISELRAVWATRWLADKAAEGRVRLGELREGLGRLQFIAGPLEFLRPFLGPLYAWCSAGPRFAQPRLPTLIVLILRYLSEELKGCHMMVCERRAHHLGEAFRIDAKAEGDCVVIGGWRTLDSSKAADAAWIQKVPKKKQKQKKKQPRQKRRKTCRERRPREGRVRGGSWIHP